MPGKVLNTKEAAAYLGMGIRTVYRLTASGQIPAAKVGGHWRFHADALDRWLISLSEDNLVKNNPNRVKVTRLNNSESLTQGQKGGEGI